MPDIYSPNKTSAKLMVDFARESLSRSDAPDDKSRKLFLMTYDLYIKDRSYALINKTFFVTAVIFGFLVLVWPVIATLSKDYGFARGFLSDAIVQTTITALAALNFAVYSHYKKRQVHLDNLMRYVVYSTEPVETLLEKVVDEMARLDSGFSFSQAVLKKPSKDGSSE